MNNINLRGKEYPILFDMNVLEQVQKRYGDVTKLTEKLSDISEIKWVFTQIINEGIEFDNFENNRSGKTLTEKQVGMLLSPNALSSGTITQTIIDALNDCLGEEKNLTAEELTKIATEIENK